VTKPDDVVLKSLELVCGQNLDMQTRKALDCCRLSLMGDSGGCSEDQNASGNADSKNIPQEASDRNKDSTGN
jgi:hypothetical protein